PFDDIQIQFENSRLGKDPVRRGRQRKLHSLSKNGAAGGEVQVLDQLLRDGRPAAAELAFLQVLINYFLHLLPVDPVMLEEAAVFGRDDGVLELRRDAIQRNPVLALVVGLPRHHRLKPALGLHTGRKWIDPAQRYQTQQSDRIKTYTDS